MTRVRWPVRPATRASAPARIASRPATRPGDRDGGGTTACLVERVGDALGKDSFAFRHDDDLLGADSYRGLPNGGVVMGTRDNDDAVAPGQVDSAEQLGDISAEHDQTRRSPHSARSRRVGGQVGRHRRGRTQPEDVVEQRIIGSGDQRSRGCR
jgi:hypothetical protein